MDGPRIYYHSFEYLKVQHNVCEICLKTQHILLNIFLAITTKFYLSIFRTLPMPRKGAAPPNLYMSWLEIMTRKMPPFLLVSFHKVPKLVKKCQNWWNSTKKVSQIVQIIFFFFLIFQVRGNQTSVLTFYS